MKIPQSIERLFDDCDRSVIVSKKGPEWSYRILGDQVSVNYDADIPVVETTETMVVLTRTLNIRSNPTTKSTSVGFLTANQTVVVNKSPIPADGNSEWRQIAEGMYQSCYIAVRYNGETLAAPVAATTDSDYRPPSYDDVSTLTGRITIGAVAFTPTTLMVDGEPGPFLAMNVREFAYPMHVFGSYQRAHMTILADEMKRIGVKFVRFYAPLPSAGDDNLGLIWDALDILHSRGMFGIICLGDSIGTTGFATHPISQSHTYSSLRHLNAAWYTEKKWSDQYMTQLREIVAEFTDHPGLGMWQLINEPTISYAAAPRQALVDAFTEFVDVASKAIYDLDGGKHPISIGMICSSAIRPTENRDWFINWIRARKHIHIVQVHVYASNSTADPAALWEHEVVAAQDMYDGHMAGRAVMIDEFSPGTVNAQDKAWRFLNNHLINGTGYASVFAPWGFMFSPNRLDLGIGDSEYGLDNVLERTSPYYRNLTNLYNSIAVRK